MTDNKIRKTNPDKFKEAWRMKSGCHNVHNGVNDSNYVLSLKIDIKCNNGNI